jgi:hypothetical protein
MWLTGTKWRKGLPEEFKVSGLRFKCCAALIRCKLFTQTDIINRKLRKDEDHRGNGERYKDRNVPGADVVWAELKGLHTVEKINPKQLQLTFKQCTSP